MLHVPGPWHLLVHCTPYGHLATLSIRKLISKHTGRSAVVHADAMYVCIKRGTNNLPLPNTATGPAHTTGVPRTHPDPVYCSDTSTSDTSTS
jgi:hypothetical protein